MYRSILKIMLLSTSVLVVPLLGNQFSDEVNWGPADFIIAWVLLVGAGITYTLVVRRMSNITYRSAVAVAVVAGLLLIWMNLAVGIIGNENNPLNLVYGGVLVVGLVSAYVARFQPDGMVRALFVTAIVQMLVTVLAGLSYSATEWTEIIGINGVFISLWVGSALLFRKVVREQSLPGASAKG